MDAVQRVIDWGMERVPGLFGPGRCDLQDLPAVDRRAARGLLYKAPEEARAGFVGRGVASYAYLIWRMFFADEQQ